MKITAAEVIVVEIPFKQEGPGVGIMPTAWKSLEFALVRLQDELGNVGWGEGFGYFTVDATRAIIERLIFPTLVGSTVTDIAEWNTQTQRRIHMFGRYGISIFAISGVDIALWDLQAKRAKLPLYALLNQEQLRRTIPFYASLVRYGERNLVVAKCREAMAAGFTSLKLHEIALDDIEFCRSAIGPQPELCVDVNCAWSASEITQAAERIRALDLTWLEEPIFPPEDFTGLAKLRGLATPIAAGENWCTVMQFREALRHEAVDIVQPSVTKVGGISEFLKILDLAKTAKASVMPHSPYFGPGFYASLHLAAARRGVTALEYNFVQPDAWMTDVNGLQCGSSFSVPDIPGLGFAPDMSVVNAYRR